MRACQGGQPSDSEFFTSKSAQTSQSGLAKTLGKLFAPALSDQLPATLPRTHPSLLQGRRGRFQQEERIATGMSPEGLS